MAKTTQSSLETGSRASSQGLRDTEAERRVLRKCDSHVLPMLYLFYMLSYLDRINIGNARIEGLEQDLRMTGNDYNIALQVFFVPYILLEVPSNIILRRVPPSTYLSFLMFMWGKFPALCSYRVGTVKNANQVLRSGIITMCQGFVTSFSALIACRFLLGCFEAGLAPGV